MLMMIGRMTTQPQLTSGSSGDGFTLGLVKNQYRVSAYEDL